MAVLLHQECIKAIALHNGYSGGKQVVANSYVRDLSELYDSYLVSILTDKLDKYEIDFTDEFFDLLNSIPWTKPMIDTTYGGKLQRRIPVYLILHEMELFLIPDGHVYKGRDINQIYSLLSFVLSKVEHRDISSCVDDLKELQRTFNSLYCTHSTLTEEYAFFLDFPPTSLRRVNYKIVASIREHFGRMLKLPPFHQEA